MTKRAAQVATGAAAVVTLLFVYLRGDGQDSEPDKPSDRSSNSRQHSEAQSEASVNRDASRDSFDSPRQAPASFKNDRISSSRLEEKSASLLSGLNAIEQKNVRTAWEGTVTNSKGEEFSATILALRKPTPEQYDQMNAAFESALSVFPPGSKERSDLQAKLQPTFLSYVSYPRDVRVLYFLLSLNGDFHSLQVSHVATDIDITPKKGGGAPGGGKVRGYDERGAMERYSHLFRLEQVPSQK